mmetsp:Transcript_20452/g.50181  ORF Transcript_20452/g.50181 Transcript_20452/m.50181 type:complete len:107 (+) Transcript_20452:896-1216(+)
MVRDLKFLEVHHQMICLAYVSIQCRYQIQLFGGKMWKLSHSYPKLTSFSFPKFIYPSFLIVHRECKSHRWIVGMNIIRPKIPRGNISVFASFFSDKREEYHLGQTG